MTEAQKEYNALLEAGELKTMFPNFKGDWEKDGKAFTRYYQDNQALLSGTINLDDEEYIDDYEN